MKKYGYRYLLMVLLLAIVLFACNTEQKSFVLLKFEDLNINFFLRGEDNVNSLLISGSQKPTIFENDLMVIRGAGSIRYHDLIFEYNETTLSINETRYSPKNGVVSNYILDKNGDIQEGFLRTFE